VSTPAILDTSPPPSGNGCVECDTTGGWWFHLRRCVECGHVGCCDSSPSQHATAHFRGTGHRLIRSFEPGEDWFWDYVRSELVDPSPVSDPLCHPVDQPTPGPAGRVPTNWQELLH
jgi:Zn-finger in ubiquitin-hydrolases and other protein